MSSSRGLGAGETSRARPQQVVGRLSHRRDRADHVKAPPLGVDEPSRDMAHLVGVGHRRAAELHDHGLERGGRTGRHVSRPGRVVGTASTSGDPGSQPERRVRYGSSARTTSGTCPAQTSSSASGVAPSVGPPVRTFADASSSGILSTAVAFELLPRRLPLRSSARQQLLGERLERDELLVGLDHRGGRPEHDDRAVVHGVLEHRACEHDPVEQRDGEAAPGSRPRACGACGLRPSRGRTPLPTRAWSVGITNGCPSVHEAEVGHERRVEDRVDRRSVVPAALGRRRTRVRSDATVSSAGCVRLA